MFCWKYRTISNSEKIGNLLGFGKVIAIIQHRRLWGSIDYHLMIRSVLVSSYFKQLS